MNKTLFALAITLTFTTSIYAQHFPDPRFPEMDSCSIVCVSKDADSFIYKGYDMRVAPVRAILYEELAKEKSLAIPGTCEIVRCR
jgi:hypothetical protein